MKYVFIIQAHNGETPQMQLIDVCIVEVVDTNADNALKRAKKLIKKKYYRVQSIIEKHDK